MSNCYFLSDKVTKLTNQGIMKSKIEVNHSPFLSIICFMFDPPSDVSSTYLSPRYLIMVLHNEVTIDLFQFGCIYRFNNVSLDTLKFFVLSLDLDAFPSSHVSIEPIKLNLLQYNELGSYLFYQQQKLSTESKGRRYLPSKAAQNPKDGDICLLIAVFPNPCPSDTLVLQNFHLKPSYLCSLHSLSISIFVVIAPTNLRHLQHISHFPKFVRK